MSAAATAVHGLTAERVATSSVSPPVALDEFVAVVRRVLDSGGTVVGHNVQFDCRAINATAKRWGTSHALSASCMLDTCRESRRFSPLVDVAGRRKAFKNAELCA
jgi:DNA polymerase III epsilon subunit-like protein